MRGWVRLNFDDLEATWVLFVPGGMIVRVTLTQGDVGVSQVFVPCTIDEAREWVREALE